MRPVLDILLGAAAIVAVVFLISTLVDLKQIRHEQCVERWSRSGMKAQGVVNGIRHICMVEFQEGYWAPESAIRR